jgi:EmrB/QacA subfamily drug resistance transporter
MREAEQFFFESNQRGVMEMFASLSPHHLTRWHRKDTGTKPQASDTTSAGVILALVAMGLGVVVLAQDFAAMNVALPNIERGFDTGISTVQWVINAYALVFAMLIVPGGKLADQFGRRRVFFAGSAVFGLMSFAAGIAPNVYALIAARALMGIGGALMWPAILGMTYAALPASKGGLAGGLIIGAAGIGQALGPINGGILTELLSWRWIQLINLPIVAFAVLVTWLEIHQNPPLQAREKADRAGILTLSFGLLAILLALDQAVSWGWGDPRIIGLIGLAAVLLTAFFYIERASGERALVPPSVIANRRFAGTCVCIALIAAPFFAALLYLPQYMQKLLLYSPIQAGVGMLPMMAVFAAVSFTGGQLYDRLGPRTMVTAGAACLALGPLLLSFVGSSSQYGALVPGMVVLGLGLGLFFSSATTAGVESVEAAKCALAGGIIYMFQIAGGSLGLGLTTTVVTSVAQNYLSAAIARAGILATPAQTLALHGLLAGTESARQVVQALPLPATLNLTRLAANAFAAGLSTGYRVDAALALIAVVIAVATVGAEKSASVKSGAGSD